MLKNGSVNSFIFFKSANEQKRKLNLPFATALLFQKNVNTSKQQPALGGLANAV